MDHELTPDWDSLRRQARQRLESLRRAGLDRIPIGGRRRPVTPAAPAETPRPPAEAPAFPSPPPLFPEPVQQNAPAAALACVPERPRRIPVPRGLFEPRPEPAMPLDQRPAALRVIEREVAGCQKCPQLVASRTRTVFGEGNPAARLMFIGEAPGADEDRTGRPFVGRAGQLLTDIITKGLRLRREDVYIANVLKCRPPDNRVPLADEVAHCRGYLERQLEVIRPERICLLGKTAAAALLDGVATTPMGKLRGRWFEVCGIRTLVTYHPAYLLRNPAGKREAWEDFKALMSELGLKPAGP